MKKENVRDKRTGEKIRLRELVIGFLISILNIPFFLIGCLLPLFLIFTDLSQAGDLKQ